MRRTIIYEDKPPISEEVKKVKFIREDEAVAKIEGAGRNVEIPEYLIPKQAIKTYDRLPFYVGNCLVIGSTGSGKSVAISNILLNVKNISHCYLFVKTMEFDDDESFRSILEKRKIPYTLSEIDGLTEVIQLVETKTEKKPLIIFDDIGTDLSKNNEFLNFIKHARKVTAGVIVSIQSHEQIPPGVYKNMKRFILFTNLPEHEVDIILEKMPSDIPKEDIKIALSKSKKQYNFITVDLLNRIITEKFDKVLYK